MILMKIEKDNIKIYYWLNYKVKSHFYAILKNLKP